MQIAAEQESPELRILNQVLEKPISHDESQLLFDIDDINSYQLEIPIYNIGEFLAQNCTIKVKSSDLQQLVLQCKEVLDSCDCLDYKHDADKDSFTDVNYYSYLNKYNSSFSDNYFKLKYYLDSISYEEDIESDIVERYPYILPISEGNRYSFCILTNLSMLLMETLYQNALKKQEYKELSLNISIVYEDLDGQKNNIDEQSTEDSNYIVKIGIVDDDINNFDDGILILSIRSELINKQKKS